MIFQLRTTSRFLRSQKGQMAIFIALIFQVLFVFFAMIVNIGLIVHDKINLQNSVDLAAYYAAQRQAELLNAIAHENYKIRQAWKLLAWRIRVLGDLGYGNHPFQDNFSGTTADVSAFGAGSILSYRLPTVCINHGIWGMKQSLCRDSHIQVPRLPSFTIINPFFAGNFAARIGVDILKNIASADCKTTGPMNFNLAIRWVRAYRMQVARSKEIIRKYADELSKSQVGFRDINGNDVRGGTLRTLDRNLTRANSKALKDGGETSFVFFNSLGAVGDRTKWLNEVPIYPTVFYTDLWESRGPGEGCTGDAFQINGMGSVNRPKHSPQVNEQDDLFRNEPTDVNDLFHSVYGVEKNPWAMAYVGVYAETKPRKPYLPFGDPITLKAKAFAKPFGGRIGPWYYKKWPQGQLRSVGNTQERIDMLAPIPMGVSGEIQATPAEMNLSVPNYSRFPGDQLGLVSAAALVLLKRPIDQHYRGSDYIQPGFYSETPMESDGLAMASGVANFGSLNKPLPLLGYPGPWIRELEVAAVAPDLFDATYYSIDQDAYNDYTSASIRGRLFPPENASYDIGSFGSNFRRNVADQIRVANAYAGPLNFWMIKEPKHLLTAWAPSGAFDYDFPSEVFGECFDEAKLPVPGKCARGGRVGYSVKIVSEDYLKSDQLPLGGEGIKGPIVNPPPNDF